MTISRSSNFEFANSILSLQKYHKAHQFNSKVINTHQLQTTQQLAVSIVKPDYLVLIKFTSSGKPVVSQTLDKMTIFGVLS